MTDSNGQTHEDAQALVVKAEHRQVMARLELEERQLMAEMCRSMPIPLRVMFDPTLNERVKAAALIMSAAEGFTPKHLIGKTEACFVVVTKALTWHLDPQAVAASTYQTPDGKVGYEGKLIQAVIEASGRLARPIGQGEYFGDWSKVEGRFKIVKKTNQYGKQYDAPEPAWTYWGDDEEGLGVRYELRLIGQDEPLKFEFMLRSAYPRNATTWPTRPKQQLHYAAMRALGNVVCPSLIMGVPWSDDPIDTPEMKDVTPITPPAPPPVDLADEQIRGGGAPQASDAPERAEIKTAKPDDEWSIEIDGKIYKRPGWAVKSLIEKAGDLGRSAFLAAYAAKLNSLPPENKAQVMQALPPETAKTDVTVPAETAGDQDPASLFEATIDGVLYRDPEAATGKIVSLIEASDNPDATLERYEEIVEALNDERYTRVTNAQVQRNLALHQARQAAKRSEQLALDGDDGAEAANF